MGAPLSATSRSRLRAMLIAAFSDVLEAL